MESSSSGSDGSPDFDVFDCISDAGNSNSADLMKRSEHQACDGTIANTRASADVQTHDGFLNFDSGKEYTEFQRELLAEQLRLFSLSFDANLRQQGFESESLPTSASCDLTMTSFMGLETANLLLPAGCNSFPNGSPTWAMPINPDEGSASQQAMGSFSIESLLSQICDQLNSDPTSPQTTAIPSSDVGPPDRSQDNMAIDASEGHPHDVSEEGEAQSLNGASYLSSKPRRSTRRRTATAAAIQSQLQEASRRNRKRVKDSTVRETRKRRRDKKPKSTPRRDAWRVVTLQTLGPATETSSAIGNAGISDSSASDNTSASTTESDSNTVSTVRRLVRRKEVFQLVEPTYSENGKLKWRPDQYWVPPPPVRPKHFSLPPGTHSDLGWVLAKLREPRSAGALYGWAIAQIHVPRRSTYLILSGPYQERIRLVRDFDRIAYSPENAENLKAGKVQGRRRVLKPQIVHDKVTIDPKELARLSSVFATILAAGEFIVEPQGQYKQIPPPKPDNFDQNFCAMSRLSAR